MLIKLLAEVAKKVNDLANRAKLGQLKPDEISEEPTLSMLEIWL